MTVRFFLFDRIVSAERGRRMEVVKLVNLSDGFFVDHYPLRPVMPGTLLIEAMAQAGGMLNFLNHDFGVEMVLALVDGVRLGRPVVQGDRLEIGVDMMYDHPYGATMRSSIHVDGETVATADRIVYAHDVVEDPGKIRLNRERFDYQCGGWREGLRVAR